MLTWARLPKYLGEVAHPVPVLSSLSYSSLLSLLIKSRGKENNRMEPTMSMGQSEAENQDDDISWHRLVLCEEHRMARVGTDIMRPGATGFRWFKSPNIVPIEQARCRRQQKD